MPRTLHVLTLRRAEPDLEWFHLEQVAQQTGPLMDFDPRSQNAFLASLGADDFEALRPHLRTVTLVQSRLLVTVGDSVTQAYLPHGGVISLVVRLAQGERVEVAMIGRDSVLNLGGVLAGPLAVSSAVVLLPGYASVIDVEQLRGAAQRSLTLRTTLADH